MADEPIKDSLGARLKYARERWGFSQKELAERANISSALISQYENDSTMPSCESLKKIAESLNISTDWLVGLVSESWMRIKGNGIPEGAKPGNALGPEGWELLTEEQRISFQMMVDTMTIKKPRRTGTNGEAVKHD